MMLYGLAGLSGLLAVSVRELKPDVSIAIVVGFTLVLTLLGVYLAGVKGYDEEAQAASARETPRFGFLVDYSYKRRIFEVLLDVVLITRWRIGVHTPSSLDPIRTTCSGNFFCGPCRCSFFLVWPRSW